MIRCPVWHSGCTCRSVTLNCHQSTKNPPRLSTILAVRASILWGWWNERRAILNGLYCDAKYVLPVRRTTQNPNSWYIGTSICWWAWTINAKYREGPPCVVLKYRLPVRIVFHRSFVEKSCPWCYNKSAIMGSLFPAWLILCRNIISSYSF